MNSKVKSILTCTLLSIAVLSIRSQLSKVFVVSTIVLLTLSIYFGGVFVVGSSVVAGLIYPLQNWGWLYGRDAYFAAYYVGQVAEIGWPVSEQLTRGFPESPLIHIFTVSFGEITSLNLFPDVTPKLLAPALLAVLLFWLLVFFIYTFGRSIRKSGIKTNLAPVVVIALLWVPMVRFRTGFRRGTLGLPLFVIGTYLLYKYSRARSSGYIALIILIGVTLPITHHFTALLFIILVATFFASSFAAKSSFSGYLPFKKTNRRVTAIFPILFGLLFTIWYFFGGRGGTMIIRYVAYILQNIGAVGGNPPNGTISISLLEWYRRTLGPLIFVGSVGILLIGSLLKRTISTQFDVAIFGFSALLVPIVALSPFVTMPIAITRVMTFFIVTGGVVGVTRFVEAESIADDSKSKIYILLTILAMVSMMMVYPYNVGLGNPDFSQAQTSQHFTNSDQALGKFINSYSTANVLYGDLNTKEVVETRSGITVIGSYEIIQRKSIPEGSAIVLKERNDWITYSSKYGGWLRVSPATRKGYDQMGNRIYDASGGQVWVN